MRAPKACHPGSPSNRRRHHPYLQGDLVESLFTEGCWMAANVIETSARSVVVRYERRIEENRRARLGPSYRCKDGEYLREIARQLGLSTAQLLGQNTAYKALAAHSRLLEGTRLDIPLVHLAREGETMEELAQMYSRDSYEMIQLNAEGDEGLRPDTKLKAGSLVALSEPKDWSNEVEMVEARELPPPLLSQLEVRVKQGADGTRSWVRAECRRLLPDRQFEVCVRGEEESLHLCSMTGKGTRWRKLPARQQAISRHAHPLAWHALPCTGEEIEVEVEDEQGKVCWRAAEVRRLAGEGKFVACVDGDEDFVEEYTIEQEDKEWYANEARIESWPMPPRPSLICCPLLRRAALFAFPSKPNIHVSIAAPPTLR